MFGDDEFVGLTDRGTYLAVLTKYGKMYKVMMDDEGVVKSIELVKIEWWTADPPPVRE